MIHSILITGGSGTFGAAFARRVLLMPQGPERIAILSRGEHRQAVMAAELEPIDHAGRLRMFIGDVRDRDRLRRAMRGVDVVVHAAALKRIETAFYNPDEVVKTNVGGAVNVIEAAQEAGVKKVVALSSDKAFQPVSPYGHSKAMADSLFLAANNISGSAGPRFAICRYGNIWCSAGSVVPKWRSLMGDGEFTVPVTDPDCTRFFMRIDEAVDLVLRTIETMAGGEMAIPTLPAYRLGDLAQAMGVGMMVGGLPPFEKMHESMEAGNSSDKARRMSVDELKSELEAA